MLLLLTSVFLLFSFINIMVGFLFWIKNINKPPLEIHMDAPYTYYQKNYPQQFENGRMTAVAINKPEGEIRILLLGGSVAANIGNLRYSKEEFKPNSPDNYLQEIIQKHFPAHKIRLINGAAAAYVSEQEFIVFQKHMQYYQPDIVVALHGFNDVESFRLNHKSDDPKFIPSPIFYAGSWNSPIFRIVENHKRKYTFAGIFDGYYNHLQKAFDFSLTQINVKKTPSYDTTGVTGQLIKRYATEHANIVADLNDFCRAKEIKYLNFLQPVRFYHPNDSNYHGLNKTPISEALSYMYYHMEQLLKDRTYHTSLTSMEPGRLDYTDECHTTASGYRYMADSMAIHIRKSLQERVNNKSGVEVQKK